MRDRDPVAQGKGRSVYGDFMDDKLNQRRLYELLLEASDKIQEALVLLRDFTDEPCDGGQSAYQMGVLSSAQELIEGQIDVEDFPALKSKLNERMNKKLLWAMNRSAERSLPT